MIGADSYLRTGVARTGFIVIRRSLHQDQLAKRHTQRFAIVSGDDTQTGAPLIARDLDSGRAAHRKAGSTTYPTVVACNFLFLSPFISMDSPEAGQSAPENNAAQTTGLHKQKFRAFAEPIDYLIADLLAKDKTEAWKIARRLNIGDFRRVSDGCDIKTIVQVDESIESTKPFCPVN